MQFVEENFLLRNPSSHDYHCSLLTGPLAKHDSITYGVNCTSTLNDLDYFHVANFQLPQDIMHVLLEGVVPYEIKLMLTEFIHNLRYFTLEFLNHRIESFTYGPGDCKPVPIAEVQVSPGNLRKLHDSGISCFHTKVFANHFYVQYIAAQMWVLSSNLPMIIGSEVPDNDRLWESFLMLLHILDVCTTHVLSEDLVDHLRTLIKDHHTSFKQCYPGASITPKLHYMVHFPTQIRK